MKQKLFTKSAFKTALNCQTQLYYSYKRDEYANQELEDDFLQSLAEGGFQVGELAKVYYGIPPKMDIEELDYDASVAADPSKRNAVFENLRTEYATNMEKVSDDARGGISKTISDFSSVTDKFSKSVSTQGADVRASVDPHRVAVRKANKDAIKKSGK